MFLPFLISILARRISSHQDHVIRYLREENRLLQAKLPGKRLLLTDTERRRLALLAHPLTRTQLNDLSTLATPDTVRRWYRRLVAPGPRLSPQGKALGRPRVSAEIEQLTVRMANENPTWGYRRIQGALSNLGSSIDNTTVRNILRRHHIDPAPMRGQVGLSWSQFTKMHWEVCKASGFCATPWPIGVRLWTAMPQIGGNLSARWNHLLGFVVHGTLSVSIRGAQQWHQLWSRCLHPGEAQYGLPFGRRHVPEGSFQAATPRVKACRIEQERSPPEARRLLLRPDGDLNGGKSVPRYDASQSQT